MCSELETVGIAAGLVVLKINGAARGRRSQVDLVGDERVFIGSYPVAEGVSVVSGNDRYFCQDKKRYHYETNM